MPETPVLMVQGTASGVGKSLIVTGLCRLLHQMGHRVAPFKAQNMSNNSFVTADGYEIARSTAVQAEAACIEPTQYMNPLLLKPEADSSSQVVVLGRPIGSLSARGYTRRKLDFWPTVTEALARLRGEFDVIVAEGAGSPAEINLREHDVVNMRLALHAGASVLLVGDIDRGGIFAQLLGTLDLLSSEERGLVKGLVVNRFRGDPSLFDDGVDILERRSGKPVIGVVPYVPDLAIAQEDSVGLEDRRSLAGPTRPDANELDIIVIRLPRISNFDDFDPLDREPGVQVRYVDSPRSFGRPDLVILPGTKTTVSDLNAIRANGLAGAIVAAASAGVPVIGICGGYQMLGRLIRDPLTVESSEPMVEGLALLPVETVFSHEKRTTRAQARVVARKGPLAGAHGKPIAGYEIHMGRSTGAGEAPFQITRRLDRPVDEPDGASASDGLVTGTYLHGLFANEPIRRSILDWLRSSRPMPAPTKLAQAVDPYDRWADVLRRTLDLEQINQFIEELGVNPRDHSGGR